MSSASPNSTRISKRFAELRTSGELGIVVYITAGDPSLDATLKFVLALAEAGADVIELGVPFSDPLADGPTIQRASERALKSGTTLAGVLDLVRRIRQSSPPANDVPLVLFSYYNPILQMGLEKFAAAAAAAGADGVLATDLTPEESGDYRRIFSIRFSSARPLPRTSASLKSPPAPPASSISSPAPALPARKMLSPTICPRFCAGPAASRNYPLPSASASRSPATSPSSAVSPTPPSSARPSCPKLKKPLCQIPHLPPLTPPLPLLPTVSTRSRKLPATVFPAARPRCIGARSPHEYPSNPSSPNVFLSTFNFHPLFRNGPRWPPFSCLSFRAKRPFCAPNVFSERGICFCFRSEAAS